jgi:hypothetical protein
MRRTLNISFNNDACNSFTYSIELDHADASASVTYRHLGDISALINQIKVTIPHESYSVNDPMYMAHAEALSRQLRGVAPAHAPVSNAELATAHVSNVELEWLISKYHAAANKPVVDPTPAGRKRMVNFVNNMTRGQYSREQVEEIVEKIIKDAYNRSMSI